MLKRVLKMFRTGSSDKTYFFPFLLHLFCVAIFSAVIFGQNRQYLFIGYDGAYNWLKVKFQYDWMLPGLAFGNIPLQELGNVFLAHNCWLFPCYIFAGLLRDGVADHVTVYVISCVFLFAVSYVAWRCFEVEHGPALLASWVVCILCLPLVRPLIGYQITAIVPHYSALIAETTLACALFYRLGKGSAWGSVGLGLLATTVVLHAAAGAPPVFSLAIPAYFALIVYSFFRLRDRRELRHKLLFMLAFGLFSAVSVAPFLLGTVLYTVPAFFAPELLDYRRTLDYTSVLFVDPFTGGILLVLCLTGAVCCLRRRVAPAAPLARLTLVVWALVLVTGFATTYIVTHYVGPSQRDFELFFYPLYSLFVSYALLSLLGFLSGRLPAGFLRNAVDAMARNDGWCRSGLTVGLVLLLYSLGPWTRHSTGYEWPMGDNAIGAKLSAAVGLSPAGPFRGAVATITRKGEPESSNTWTDHVSLDAVFTRTTGNDYRALGLWRRNIPTAFAYNQLMTPQYYAMLTRMASRPVDKQVRNVLVLTQMNPDYLASLGVRYVVVSGFVPPPYEAMTGGKIVLLPEYTHVVDSYPVYLFEVRTPNVGSFSPVNQIMAATVAEALAKLTAVEKPFDYTRDVLLTQPLGKELVPGEPASISISREGMRIKASSGGTSLLLLPLQFSHCLTLRAIGPAGAAAQLVRANVMQAGLVYSGNVDVLVSFRYGPFQNQFARIKDYLDMRRLQLSAVGLQGK